ncbi:MAG: hypothetical protein AAF734_11760 [Bacteroidota bacterium]
MFGFTEWGRLYDQLVEALIRAKRVSLKRPYLLSLQWEGAQVNKNLVTPVSQQVLIAFLAQVLVSP